MIVTIVLVIVGVAIAWAGYANGDNTLLTFGMIVLIVAAAVGIFTMMERGRRP